MEKRINKKLEVYISKFKDDLREELLKINVDNQVILPTVEFLYEYPRLIVNKEDLIKRKRIKNSIPSSNRCNAKRADGDQCTRRRKENCEYCGTHVKGTPHGLITCEAIEQNQDKKVDVEAQEINGIVYFLDKFNNVYNTEDIMKKIVNPRIIAKYKKTDNTYFIVDSVLV